MTCPKCGSDAGYVAHDYVYGWVEFLGDWLAPEDSPNYVDGLIHRRSKTAICVNCDKRIPRPED